MTDFFISYTHADENWAEWIAYTLEDAGFSVVIQAWDFRPGSNFVLEMQRASQAAERTILVLSPDYLNSRMAAPEWASAFAQDPEGVERRLVPVMVRRCEPAGLLPAIVQIRIMDMDEDRAREVLLAGLDRKRAKPTAPPAFPGQAAARPTHKDFPGETAPAEPARTRAPVLPARRPTDADRRKFVKAAYELIRDTFEKNLAQAQREETRIEVDFTMASAVDFRAELFVDGKSSCKGRVWLGGMMGENNICVAEGQTSGDACNEILAPADDGSLALASLMSMGLTDAERSLDMKRLTPEQAAEYLWTRFIRPLGWR